MVFEVGKCYVHISGYKMRIIGELDTYMHGHALIGEDMHGELIPVGNEEYNAVNFTECPDFALEPEPE